MESTFHAIHKLNDPLIQACSSNETAMAIAGMEIAEIVESLIEERKKEYVDNFIPSEKDSVSSHRDESFYFNPIFHFWMQSIYFSHF